ncbi:Vacuolar calcium ion transporter [Penicillium subrubescens]|uniref:Vacuolar calcium ion transporter n=1 Tax=Penicillium subrubescens TaxID=1316194 RepID=UPI0025455119|nr:Vacuolar calcium ion transporter [Penicillium subrubescens]KAJ5875026.1 Vacuolar calcium ion transporter [Penicillium subrubescens]
MHRYLRQAHKLAWYDQDGTRSTYNPFKRYVRGPIISVELGEQFPRSRSMGDLRLPDEPTQQAGLDGDFPRPAHAYTFPAEGTGSLKAGRNSLKRSINCETDVSIAQAEGEITQDAETQCRQQGDFDGILGSAGEVFQSSGVGGGKDLDGPKFSFGSQIRATLFNSWINVLLVAAPVGIALHATKANPIVIFVTNFIAIIPLAAMLSYATEEIAMRTGETIGGLLNASFGNAVELIVAILALVKHEVVIVQTSLIGSMLSNLLLVMGMCFFFGGMNRVEQHFNLVVAQTAICLLALAMASVMVPTALYWRSNTDHAKTTSSVTTSSVTTSSVTTSSVSRGISVLLLIVYPVYLFFQLKSHADLFNEPSKKVAKRSRKAGEAGVGIAEIGAAMARALGGSQAQHINVQYTQYEPEQPQLLVEVAIGTLVASTVLVALCAEFMVDSIDALTATGHVSETFVGLILLPIVGNAAEHATAVTVAYKDKMDLAVGVAVGSSIQIALLVLPLIVILGWIIGVDDMTLNFDVVQVTVLFLAFLLVTFAITHGKSNWFAGVLLIGLYVILAIVAWFG